MLHNTLMNRFEAVIGGSRPNPGIPYAKVRNLTKSLPRDQNKEQNQDLMPSARGTALETDLGTGLAAEHLEVRLCPPVGPPGVQGIMDQVSEVLPCDPGLVKRIKTK